jgi:signal transduction histidine kinase
MSRMDRTTLELLPDATVVVAADGIVTAANQLACRLAGRADLEGRKATDVLPLFDEVGQDWWACMAPLSGDARLAPRLPETDLVLRTDARNRPVTLTAARMAGDRGEVVQLVLSLRKAELRARRDANRSELISTVSHELRSPLTSVRGFTKTLLDKWERFTDEQKQHMLRTVIEDADRVTRLLSELLDVSRIDAGQLRLRRQMVAVPTVVDRVVQRFAIVDEERPIQSVVPHDLERLYADPDKVEQVFTNLVENAMQYGAGQVEVRARELDASVEFCVADEGDGIPPGQMPYLFAKFSRRAGERRSGTGLGLYISKGIVEAHGGRIWAAAGEGGGTRFLFTLPKGGLELAGIGREGRGS